MVVYSVDHMTQYTPWANVDFCDVEVGHTCSYHCALRVPFTHPFHIYFVGSEKGSKSHYIRLVLSFCVFTCTVQFSRGWGNLKCNPAPLHVIEAYGGSKSVATYS